MIKYIRRLILLGAVFLTVFVFSGLKAYAGDFDPAYYSNRYPDVAEAYGDNAVELYQHYVAYGRHEHRFKNAEEERTGKWDETLDTYVDVSIESQTMTYIQNGEVVLTSPCVTGNVRSGNSTPTGEFVIRTKIPGKYLVGPTWNVWVDRWMRFTDLCGLHDANWRGQFGGEIYQTNGSHGCVNLPSDVAKSLYDMVSVGTAVLIH